MTGNHKSYFITGGLGFVGNALVRKIRSNDPKAEIHVYDSDLYNRTGILPNDAGIFVHKKDIRDADELSETIKRINPSVVFHLAALHFIPDCIRNPKATWDVNVGGTQNVVNAIKAQDNPSTRFVFASSAAVYRDKGDDPEPFSENDPLEGIDIYGATKVEGEHLIKEGALTNTTIARFFNVVGKADPVPHLIPAILQQIAEGKREVSLGNTAPRRDYIDARDVASALLLLAHQSQNPQEINITNVGNGFGRSVIDVLNEISEAIGEKITILTDPQKIRPVDRMHLVSDITKLKQAGWRPDFSFKDSVNQILEPRCLK